MIRQTLESTRAMNQAAMEVNSRIMAELRMVMVKL